MYGYTKIDGQTSREDMHMGTNKIIPRLNIKDGLVVKGVNFDGLRELGAIMDYVTKYEEQGADELVLLDIAATVENSKTLPDVVKEVVKAVNIPITAGGGIKTVEEIGELLDAGASRVTINTAAVKNPQILKEGADKYGKDKVILAVDARKRLDNSGWDAYINDGRINTGKDLIEWVKEGAALGAGAIMVTSMDTDGTKDGYDIELCKACKEATGLEIIASGGCGSLEDFASVFIENAADGALASSMFHFGNLTVSEVKDYLKEKGIE